MGDQLREVVHVDNDVDAAPLRLAELLRVHAGEAHGLPRGDGVGLARGVHGLVELLELDEHHGQARIVVDVVEQDLGRLVELLREALLAAVGDLGHVGLGDELVQVREAVGLGEAVDDLVVDQRLLHLGARHLEVGDEVVEQVLVLGRRDHVLVVAGVVGLEERLDRVLDHVLVQLRLGQDRPHLGLVPRVGELGGALDRVEVLQQHADGLGALLELLVDEEGLLVQLVLVRDRDLGDVGAVVVVQALDVVHHALLVGLDGREDEQVLQVLVALEVAVRRAVQDDALEQLDELVGQVGRHEGLDRVRDLLGHARLGQSRRHDLVDQLPAELVLLIENLSRTQWHTKGMSNASPRANCHSMCNQ